MKKLLLLVIFTIPVLCFSQKYIYESKQFSEISKEHKTIAIIPFLATLNLENAADFSKEEIKKLGEKEGFTVQNALENYFLRRKKKKKIKVDIQNTEDTNALLRKNNITLKNINVYTTQELCNILGVDAIISGNIKLKALISQGVSTSYDFISLITGKSDYGRIAIKISDGKTGKLLWKYEKTISRKAGKNTYVIIEKMMRKAARKFPYNKK